jgi:hypothetical protein
MQEPKKMIGPARVGCHPLSLASMEAACLSGTGTSPVERGGRLSESIQVAAASGKHTSETKWLFDSLQSAGLTVLQVEAPLVSDEFKFATFVDMLCETADGDLVAVEVKLPCGGMAWMCGCLGPPTHEYAIHETNGWFNGELNGIPGCALGRATAQAKLAAVVLHKEYNIPKDRVSWAVVLFCGIYTSVCIIQGRI